MGTLYVVATPIGNLEDITIRAIKTLLQVDAIACEDTRKTRQLLYIIRDRYGSFLQSKYGSVSNGLTHYTPENKLSQQLLSYYEQNEQQRIPEVINALKNGLSVALVSDAGTPTVSDPGFKLVRECLREGIKVESIPGPSSVISALVSSGLPTDKFLFLGYPPKKPGHRKKLLQNITSVIHIIEVTVIMFEAPHKLVRTLREMQEVFGDIDVCLARELTKLHEESVTRSISDHLQHFDKQPPKGEFVLLFRFSKEDVST